MKKDTVSGWLLRQQHLARHKEKNDTLRNAKLAALRQCEQWLFALTWAEMRAPVRQKRVALKTEELVLEEKEKQDPAGLTEQETLRLQALRASDEIYAQFFTKITPTARQAEFDREQRKQTGRRN